MGTAHCSAYVYASSIYQSLSITAATTSHSLGGVTRAAVKLTVKLACESSNSFDFSHNIVLRSSIPCSRTMANWIEQADQQLSVVLSDWSLVTTAIALAIVTLLAYPIFFPDEPDTHPLLLARQSQASPVRQKNESAAYRSPETPHGYGLKTGLNVKPPGAPRWASGKDGDLRDVWREVCKGGQKNEDGTEVSKGLIMTVLGSEEVEEHEIEDVSTYIAVVGQHLKDKGVKRVAIYLPNSLEYIVTIFGTWLLSYRNHYELMIHSLCLQWSDTDLTSL